MKLSCLPVSLYQDLSAGRHTLADWFVLAAGLGLDGADISVAHLPSRRASDLQALAQQAAAAGVPIVAVVTYADFTHPDPAERARQIDDLRANIAAAATLGASFLRVTAGQAHPGVERAAGIAWAVAGLTAALADAAEAQVTLMFENHSIGYGWHHFDFSYPADVFLEIVAQTEGTGLGVLYDTANTLSRGDDPLAVLAAVQHRLAMVHVNDIRQAGQFEPVLVGSGVAPIQAIFEALHAAGFDGWISLEEASRTGEAGFRQGVAFIDRLWAKVSGSSRKNSL